MIKFGTDGWRAIIADQFTFDNVRACAQGVADYMKQKNLAEGTVVIGNDTRFNSDEFALACAEVLAGNGIKVLLCSKPTPTPVISYTVKTTKSIGGIVITASHNPGIWNGFKYKNSSGASASSEIIALIEENTNKAIATGNIRRKSIEKCLKTGEVVLYDPNPEYKKQIERLVDMDSIRKANLKIIVDPMYGAGIGYFSSLLKGMSARIIEINGERNPLFPGIRPEPIMPNLLKLCSLVKEEKASVGLATDGDADRIGIVSDKGEFINQLLTFALLALYFIEIHKEKRPIIRTICSTNMLEHLGRIYNIPVYTTKVGFKYVAPLMLEKDAFIGGEESGGYGFSGHVPERDGILAGLYFLDYMIKTGRKPSQLIEHLFDLVGEHYYDRIDLHITPEQHQDLLKNIENKIVNQIAGVKVIRLETTDGYKYHLDDDSWLLIRFSGTEPLIRIYAESRSSERVKKMLEVGKEIVGI